MLVDGATTCSTDWSFEDGLPDNHRDYYSPNDPEIAALPHIHESPLSSRMVPDDEIRRVYAMHPELPHDYKTGCPTCGKNCGKGYDGVVFSGGVMKRCRCRDQLQRMKWYYASGIGLTYMWLGKHDFHGDPKALEAVSGYVKEMEDKAANGTGLILSSKGFGNGKTLLATIVLKAAIWKGYTAYFTTMADFVSNTRMGWHDKEYQDWFKRRVAGAKFLVIDDLGRERVEGAANSNAYSDKDLDSLLRTRVQNGQVTIVTTNFDMKGLGVYGDQIHSLLTEKSIPVIVEGEDYRGKTEKVLPGRRVVK